jgi:hypothetical protein
MRREVCLSWLAVGLLILFAAAAAIAGGGGGISGGGTATAPGRSAGDVKVSLKVKNASFPDTFRLLFEGTDQSFVLHPVLHDRADRITITLNNVQLEHAVRAICKLYVLEYETDQAGLWVIMPSSDFVTFGGRDVPLLGAAPVDIERGIAIRQGRGGRPRVVTRVGRMIGSSERPPLQPFRGDEKLVDLHIEDGTIRQAIAEMSKASGVEMVVHKAVPEDIKVTARVYQMSVGEVLGRLLAEANLDYSVDGMAGKLVEQTELEGATGRIAGDVVHIVPRPELRVSGPGVGLEAVTARMEAARARLTAAEAFRAWAEQTGESRRSLGFELCPQCGDQVMMLHWKFCPHCGTKLPADEEPPEKAE